MDVNTSLPTAPILEELHRQLASISSTKKELKWKELTAENLNITYSTLLSQSLANTLMEELEKTIHYYTGDLTKVKIFGKWHQIPRQQVAYGDQGLKYTFSGTTIAAKPWLPVLTAIKELVEKVSNQSYNFVLINRYRNGNDHIGEHRDDEKELNKHTPIASLSLGQERTFVLKHRDARLKGKLYRKIASVKIQLEHGSLLLMNYPTNEYWYHSLPQRRNCPGVRINLTFRKINS
ncbi:DNA oxidative demethylase ALKBH2-like [Euwallacea fornicatus]|uniref:DNA oxidative demethylase ALKBH2-like n=1 Tax=Euwallacea fornicatus TaxID=995702 RepID=UPI00338F663F